MTWEKLYRVANPMDVPSYYHVLRFKEPDEMDGDVLVMGRELFAYEDDIVEVPNGMKPEELRHLLDRGFLVERYDG